MLLGVVLIAPAIPKQANFCTLLSLLITVSCYGHQTKNAYVLSLTTIMSGSVFASAPASFLFCLDTRSRSICDIVSLPDI